MQNTDAQTKTEPAGSNSHKGGRPTTYRESVGALICARLSEGETLTEICRTPGMPARQTVHQWRRRFPQFDDDYMRARADGMESMADELLTIADDDTGDLLPDGSPNHANVGRARLMVDARKFLMSKLSPRYADKVEHQHTGAVAHLVTLDDRERMRRLASFMLEDQRAGALIEGQAGRLHNAAEEGSQAGDPARPTSEGEPQPGAMSKDSDGDGDGS